MHRHRLVIEYGTTPDGFFHQPVVSVEYRAGENSEWQLRSQAPAGASEADSLLLYYAVFYEGTTKFQAVGNK